uniref:Expressed protein n=2 Tax=Schizophyllum commune (strain H4-8 / FGSC 9210) TaxID=578458 RepID=D8PP49_SCHCM
MPFLRSLGSLRHIALTNGNSLPSLRHWPDLQSLHVSGSLTKSSVFPSMVRKVETEATTKVRLILSDADTLAENIPLHRTPGGGYRLITAEEAELEDPEEEEWSDEYPDPGDFDDDRWGDGEDWGEFWGEDSDTEQLGNDHTSFLPTPMYRHGHSGDADNSDAYGYADYNSGYGYDYDYAW